MQPSINWVKIAFYNLSIVAIFGLLMRYKISFNLPIFEQRHLLHAHSHFAFSGWLSVFFYYLIYKHLRINSTRKHRKYIILMLLNLLFSYGILVFFTLYGYNFLSITMATGTVFVSYIFLIFYITDYKHIMSREAKRWFLAALAFNALSSLGTFVLGYLAASNAPNHKWFLAGLYFYLHFQYNGFYLFTAIGITAYELYKKFKLHWSRQIFPVFVVCTTINYLLNILWVDLAWPIYIIVVLCAIVQLVLWLMILRKIIQFKQFSENKIYKFAIFLFTLSILALTLKMILQVVSTYPGLSDYVYGFRTVVIAYLHLVFLGVFTIFLIAYSYAKGYFLQKQFAKISIWIFIIGIFLNEFVLMIQGIGSLVYFVIPNIELYLLGVAVILVTGALLLASNKKRTIMPKDFEDIFL